MAIYWVYLAAIGLSMGLAVAITPAVNAVSKRCGRVDAPAARKVHRQPMVRLGGVAIFSAMMLTAVCFLTGPFLTGAAAYLSPSDFLPTDVNTARLLLLGGAGFFVIGLADDLLDLSALHRLAMQVGISSYLWRCDIRISDVTIPGFESVSLGWLSLPITVLWLAGVVNAINWIDGLDGLAAGVASVALGCLVVLSGGVAGIAVQPMLGILCGALLGSLLGFLCYNSHPAKIFMGDGGSYFVGFMLASFCMVESGQITNAFPTLFPLIVLMVPLADMVSVIATRLYCKKSPFEADNRHLHHRLLAIGFSHSEAVWVIYALAVATGCLAMAAAGAAHGGSWIVAMSALLLSAAYVVVRQLWRAEARDSMNTIRGNEIW